MDLSGREGYRLKLWDSINHVLTKFDAERHEDYRGKSDEEGPLM